jgi:hypothetical protein
MAFSKYIIVNNMGIECPIVFSPLLKHSDILVEGKTVSAGFCFQKKGLGELSYETYGKSVSLNLSSRPEDAEILNKLIEYNC